MVQTIRLRVRERTEREPKLIPIGDFFCGERKNLNWSLNSHVQGTENDFVPDVWLRPDLD